MARAKRTMPDQDYLRECFDYDPDTGSITWRVRPPDHFVNDGQWRRWNKLYSLKPAACSRHKFGHAQICLMDQNWPAHRLIYKLMTGEEPAEVDHRDDPANNRWYNLRSATSNGNNRNRRRLTNHSTGFKGVCKVSGSRRFGATIRVNGEHQWLGTFATPEEAHAAYCAAARRHFGEFWNPG